MVSKDVPMGTVHKIPLPRLDVYVNAKYLGLSNRNKRTCLKPNWLYATFVLGETQESGVCSLSLLLKWSLPKTEFL